LNLELKVKKARGNDGRSNLCSGPCRVALKMTRHRKLLKGVRRVAEKDHWKKTQALPSVKEAGISLLTDYVTTSSVST
jgi:hypothetical protein